MKWIWCVFCVLQVLASQIMRSTTLSGLQREIAPALNIVLRDKAHASRRTWC